MKWFYYYSADAASVGSSASEKGPGSGRNSPVVRDKKLFKGTGVKKETGSLGKLWFLKYEIVHPSSVSAVSMFQ